MRQDFVRAKPLLGTRVDIRVGLKDEAAAHAAIDRGFDAIAKTHRLMSFHESASDVSRLNRTAAAHAVAIDPWTFEVLQRAQDLAAHSDGLFDITIARRLVDWGFLPAPAGAPTPVPDATWRDVVFESENHVRFRRPLWIDLGGIAKGFAVDRAIAAIALEPDVQVVVNAGGDLRVAGPRAERVTLRSTLAMDTVPVVEIADGALASSSGDEHARMAGNAPYVDARTGASMGLRNFACVAARDCMTADALTKVVLAAGLDAEGLLCQFGAIAYFYEPARGWMTLGAADKDTEYDERAH
jgi:FAD:protein FMN transferase